LDSKIETKQTIGKKHRVSFQVLPETEVNTENNSLDEIEETHPEFCHLDVNENVGAQPDIYVRDTKPVSFNKCKAGESCSNSLSLDNIGNIQGIDAIIEYIRGFDLRRIYTSGLGFAREQLKPFEQGIVQEEFALCDKIKLLTELKSLHKRIQTMDGNGKELKEVIGKEDDILNLIPKSFINMFKNLKGNSTESTVLKIQICRDFGELRDFSTRDFLDLVGNDPQESTRVKEEALGAWNALTLEIEIQRKERIKDHLRTEGGVSKENFYEEEDNRESMGWIGKKVSLFGNSATKLKKENVN